MSHVEPTCNAGACIAVHQGLDARSLLRTAFVVHPNRPAKGQAIRSRPRHCAGGSYRPLVQAATRVRMRLDDFRQDRRPARLGSGARRDALHAAAHPALGVALYGSAPPPGAVLRSPGVSGDSGVSRLLRRLRFWILVPDTRRFRWGDRATHRSSGARSLTCSPRGGASRASRTISTPATRRSTTGRRQDRIDRGLQAGPTTAESAELAAAMKRIAELETELEVTRRAVEVLKEETSPKGDTRRSS